MKDDASAAFLGLVGGLDGDPHAPAHAVQRERSLDIEQGGFAGHELRTRGGSHGDAVVDRLGVLRGLEVVFAHVLVPLRDSRIEARKVHLEMNADRVPQVLGVHGQVAFELVRLALEALDRRLRDEHHLVLTARPHDEVRGQARPARAREESDHHHDPLHATPCLRHSHAS